jgi:hypothetical protein
MTNQTETKRQAAIEATISPEHGLLNLTFANGRKLNLHLSELSSEMQTMAMLHGLKQKLVDAAAISRDPETGRSATVEQKYQAVFEVFQRLLDGNWNAPREGNGGASLLLAAMVEFSGKPQDVVKTWLETKSDAEKKALSLNPKVAAIINRIRAERAKVEGIDSDDLLSELA